MLSGSRIRKIVIGAAATAALASGGLVAGQAPANADPHFCGESDLVHEITVSQWDQGQWQIHVTPKGAARVALNPRGAVDTMWHAVQACVPGLYRDLADTIYQQLDCHQRLSAVPWPGEGSIFKTGDTYDLESWRPKLVEPDIFGQEVHSSCLNDLSALSTGGDPAGPFGDPIRPDLGQTDLVGANSTIG
jgi:hypothetical protein